MDSLYFLIKSLSSGESPNLSNMNSDFTSAAKVSLLRISKFFNNKFHFFLPHPKHSPLRMKESLFVASEQVLDTSE